jgi:imidazolonepropionase-like amidohydrolase
MKWLWPAGALLLAAATAGWGQPPPSDRPLAITNVTVINPGPPSSSHQATVIIRDGKISEVGDPAKIRIPVNAEVVAGAGKFLIPGLWDMHMHLSYLSESAFPLLIANGITGVCDMGGDLEQIDRWRDEITRQTRVGPRIVRSGPVLDGPRTEEGQYRITINNPAEGREAVVSLKKRGVDFIKVYHFLSRESYFAIADESKRQRIPFAGHVPNGMSPEEAADAGQRSLEHTAILIQAEMSLEKKEGRTAKQRTAEAIDALLGAKGNALAEAMVKHGTWHTPTLVVARSFLLRPELAAKKDDRRKYMPRLAREHWEKNNPVPQNVSEQEMSERHQALQRMFEIVRTLHKAGVEILAGTDPPTRDVFPGFSLHDELGLLVKAGLTPLEALQSATSSPAKCLGLSDSLGAVEKGKAADLVLLDADPASDIANTQKISGVFVCGKFFARPALEEMLEQTEKVVNSP